MKFFAKWIAAAEKFENAPIFRKHFQIDKPIKSAKLYISGLGCYIGTINGESFVPEGFIGPSITNYDKRVFYNEYDIKNFLCCGENEITVILGRGFYDMDTWCVWRWHMAPWRDERKLISQMEIIFEDDDRKIIISDESWEAGPSQILKDCFYMGELQDANFNTEYKAAVPAIPPRGKLQREYVPSVQAVKKSSPVMKKQCGAQTYVYDFGAEYTGYAEIICRTYKEQKIEVSYYENLESLKPLESEHIKGVLQRDTFIGDGKEQLLRPLLSYKGFRYVVIKGASIDTRIRAVQTNNDVERIGEFSCSNEILNWIYNAAANTYTENLHGIMTDTPVYEKNGWTGDTQLISAFAMNTFDAKSIFEKFIDDMEDSQSYTGELPKIAPTIGWGMEYADYGWLDLRGPVPAWDAAFIIVPYNIYIIYGDLSPAKAKYAAMKRYMDYLLYKSEDYIIDRGLGDWLFPCGNENGMEARPEKEGSGIISTMYFSYMSGIMAFFAQEFDMPDDRDYFISLRNSIKRKINEIYYNKEQHMYFSPQCEEYRQTPNILAVKFGICSDEDADAIVERLSENISSKNNHLDTGIIGTRYLFEVLTDYGYGEQAYKILNQTDYPGFGFFMKNGHSTLLEHWEKDSRSNCHFMFGGFAVWFYEYILGIHRRSADNIIISPFMPQELTYARGKTGTACGDLSVAWKKTENGAELEIYVPSGVTASFEGKEKIPLNEGKNTVIINF